MAKKSIATFVGALALGAVGVLTITRQIVVVTNGCSSSAHVRLTSARLERPLGEWTVPPGDFSFALLSTGHDHDDSRSVEAELDGTTVGAQRYYHAGLMNPYYGISLVPEGERCEVLLGR